MSTEHRWGAWPVGDGRWSFALWAPAAEYVELILEGEALPMTTMGDGWFGTQVAAPAGAHYRFRMDGSISVADPASRWQPEGLSGPSALLATDHAWKHPWRGRPWREAVIYELHIGAAGGSYASVSEQLPALAALGITAIELMPVASFPGTRNWGYDGVLHYAPAAAYGHPAELKALVDRAHGLGMMVLLDVVYNHFGPQGNPLSALAPAFYRTDVATPWGDAIDFREPAVQRYFIDNALMWLEEYRFDGLRLDAVHAIQPRHFLQVLQAQVRAALPGRHVHLVLENEDNRASLLAGGFTAQWNDDFHNALHVLLTGEDEGYYRDFADAPVEHLRRVLAEGFAWQGEVNRAGRRRGERSASLPPERFVVFSQNHDQVGNRAHGERLVTLVGQRRASLAIALTALTPMVPLFFMGEPWGASTPFLFFTDYGPPLDAVVRDGRRGEFAQFSAFQHSAERAAIPDPNAVATFELSRCAWPTADDVDAAVWLEWFGNLLAVRARWLCPAGDVASLGARVLAPRALCAGWQVDERQWWLAINLGSDEVQLGAAPANVVFRIGAPLPDGRLAADSLMAWVAPLP